MPRGVRGSGRVKTPAARGGRRGRPPKNAAPASEESGTGEGPIEDTTQEAIKYGSATAETTAGASDEQQVPDSTTKPPSSDDTTIPDAPPSDADAGPAKRDTEEKPADTQLPHGWKAINVEGDGVRPASSAQSEEVVPATSIETSDPSTTQNSSTDVAKARPAPLSRVSSLRAGALAPGGRSASPAASILGGKKAVKTPFYRGRRKQEERDADKAAAAAKERQEKEARDREAAERASAALRRARGGGTDRGGSGGRGRGRGRGGFMGAAERNVDVAGPFSAGVARVENRTYIQKARQDPKSSRVKREDGQDGALTDKTQVDGGYISSDPDDLNEGPRFNVDSLKTLHIESDEDEAGSISASSARKTRARSQPSLVPVRLDRREHKERVMGINTEASAATASSKQTDVAGDTPIDEGTSATTRKGRTKSREVEVTGSRSFQGAWKDTDSDEHVDAQVKEEPHVDEDISMIEPGSVGPQPGEEPRIKTPSSSPERRRKSNIKATTSIHRAAPMPAIQTEEERQEWNRFESERQTLKDELGDIPADDSESKRADRVYIFQLPPVMPSLKTPEVKGKDAEIPGDVQDERGTSTTGKGKGIAKESLDTAGSSTKNPVKINDAAKRGTSASKDAASMPQNPKEEAVDEKTAKGKDKKVPKATFESGLVGKLRVYESGRATLNWGGTAFELNMGITTECLQDVVVIRRDSESVKNEDGEKREYGGDAMGFGQVRGKFVVTPDWDVILE